MLLLGCKPPGRFTEQHDIFFGVADSLSDLVPAILGSWPEAPKIHIDAWREVTVVDGYRVIVIPRAVAGGDDPTLQTLRYVKTADIVTQGTQSGAGDAGGTGLKLFFLNLGGYKPGEFEEYHYKMLSVAADKSMAIRQAKATAFYKHMGFAGADSHIDDKYGVDVDDLYEIEEILTTAIKQQYKLALQADPDAAADEWHLGYTKLSSLVSRENS